MECKDMSEQPNIYHIPISELAGSRAEVMRMADLIESEMAARTAIGIGKAAVEKAASMNWRQRIVCRFAFWLMKVVK
jgi:hypothetical protein